MRHAGTFSSLSAAAATLLLLGVGVIVASGLVVPLLVVVLLAMFARSARRDSHKPVTETARLKLALLRARLTAAEVGLVLRSPDMAQAARDRARGTISDDDYEMALIAAGDAARRRLEARRVPRFRFR